MLHRLATEIKGPEFVSKQTGKSNKHTLSCIIHTLDVCGPGLENVYSFASICHCMLCNYVCLDTSLCSLSQQNILQLKSIIMQRSHPQVQQSSIPKSTMSYICRGLRWRPVPTYMYRYLLGMLHCRRKFHLRENSSSTYDKWHIMICNDV